LSRDKAIYLAVGVALGFVVGFAMANGINSREHEQLRGELTRLRAAAPKGEQAQPSGSPQSPAEGDGTTLPQLTEGELRKAVEKADASPGDAALQRTAGQGLYLYAMQTGNSALLPDVARILKRAHEAAPDDYPVTVLAGNAHFLVARRGGGDPEALREARKYYERALAAKPDDIVVRTSLGLTYFFDRPSDAARAAREYRKALEIDPRHEMPLQSLAAALVETGDLAGAEKALRELEEVNPSNQELPNLRARLAQKRNESKERE
jgi:tetratricopeptide (TPR) repeat protein